MTMLWVALAVLVTGMLWDLRRHEIPDLVPLALLALAVWSVVARTPPRSWIEVVEGFALALTLGGGLFAAGGFGGGDVKVLAALGALIGPRDLFALCFYTALAGGVLAVVAIVRGKRDLAYAPAFVLGLVVLLAVRGLR
jgi:prepilin peptidase CpaA